MPAPTFKIETPKSLAAQVAARLREAIIDGQFALGAMVPEETLAASFGVSRTPVREALNLLQVQGLVQVKPQRGSYVFEPSAADLEALCNFRCVIEPRAAELAWVHDRAGLLAELDAAIAEMAAARRQKDVVRYSRADTRLHEAFVNRCGNPYMQAAYAIAGAKVAALRTQLSAGTDVLRPAGFEQHKRLVELLRGGDFASFEALMREHVMAACRNYTANLEARGRQAAGG